MNLAEAHDTAVLLHVLDGGCDIEPGQLVEVMARTAAAASRALQVPIVLDVLEVEHRLLSMAGGCCCEQVWGDECIPLRPVETVPDPARRLS